MPRLQASLLVCCASWFALACSAVAVETDAVGSPRLRGLATFAWSDEAGLVPSEPLPVALDRELRQRVLAGLQARGYQPAEGDDADILVAYDTYTASRDEWHDPYFRTVVFERVEEGHLTLELLAADDLEPLWSGRGRRDLRVLARKTDSLSPLHAVDEPREWELAETLAALLDSVPERR
ncbi:MAG: DUF4136 domain-containing protein [Planctomycetota bacterium]